MGDVCVCGVRLVVSTVEISTTYRGTIGGRYGGGHVVRVGRVFVSIRGAKLGQRAECLQLSQRAECLQPSLVAIMCVCVCVCVRVCAFI